MKIDESCINHNVLSLIQDLCLSDTIEDKELEEHKYLLGYIDGLVTLADRLKEVYRS